MNKTEFLTLLKHELETSRVRDVQDILADYEEHFVHGLGKGKDEEQIAKSLGSPIAIAKAYQTENMIQEIKDPQQKFSWGKALNVVGRLIVIAPFNLIVLFIPGVVLLSVLTAFWAVSLVLAGLGLAMLTKTPELTALSNTFWTAIAGVSTSLGLIGMAVLLGMIMFLVSKYILLGLINYLQWNLKFILEKQ